MKPSIRASFLFAILFAVVIILPAVVFGQCDGPTMTTVGLHYNLSERDQGLGAEFGLTGNESPISLHVNVDLSRSWYDYNDGDKTHQGTVTGQMYVKAGYRIIRVPYKVSVYTDVIGGMDYWDGPYVGAGLKILFPLDNHAISLEPMYVDRRVNLQIAYHIVI